MRKIWSRAEVDTSKDYVVLLFDDGAGLREYGLCEHQRLAEAEEHVLVTEVVPIDLVVRGDIMGISERVRLANGDPFFLDFNGVWLTKDEFEDLEQGRSTVRWVRGRAPNTRAKK